MRPFPWKEAYQMLADNMAFVVATIVSHEGSTPRTSGTKMIVTGDITQTDLAEGRSSGLRVVRRILRDVDDVGFSELDAGDVVRHRIVAAIVDAYAEYEARQVKQ